MNYMLFFLLVINEIKTKILKFRSMTPSSCVFIGYAGTLLGYCSRYRSYGLIPLTDWAQNVHSLTAQRGQNAHYVLSL